MEPPRARYGLHCIMQEGIQHNYVYCWIPSCIRLLIGIAGIIWLQYVIHAPKTCTCIGVLDPTEQIAFLYSETWDLGLQTVPERDGIYSWFAYKGQCVCTCTLHVLWNERNAPIASIILAVIAILNPSALSMISLPLTVAIARYTDFSFI